MLAGVLALLLISTPQALAAILGIDYGTEWFKMALVQPGKPLDLVLNRDSKRKTASVVVVNGLERTFGSEAVGLSGRKPEQTFFAAKQLIAADFDSALAKDYQKMYSNALVEHPLTGKAAFKYDDPKHGTLSVQEIIAMQLQHAQELVVESTGETVKDVVISVPSFYTPTQRQSMIDSANIAGLNLVALVNDGSAIALNYGMSRKFEQGKEFHIFYDMGAGSTVVTVASFSQGKGFGKSKPTEINVLATSSDPTLGGSEIDVRLRNLFVHAFESKHGSEVSTPIRDNRRAMAKLLKEAARVKTILSANIEAFASIESLHEEVDFRIKITREELQEACKDLRDRLNVPLNNVISAANVTIDDISSVILVGGSTRIPFVQEALEEVATKDKLARNLNADEACVLGTAFYGATLSSKFRVNNIRITDSTNIPYRAVFNSEMTGDDVVSEIPKFSPVGPKSTIQDQRMSDMTINFDYYTDKWIRYSSATISGVKSSINKINKDLVVDETPLVKAQFYFDEFGVPKIHRAVAIYNTTNPEYESYLEQLSSWEQSVKDEEAKTDSTSEAEAKPRTPKPKVQQKHIIERVTLKVNSSTLEKRSMNGDALQEARDLLKRMNKDDKQRKDRETAFNSLESLVYQIREIIYEDDFITVTTKDERAKLEKKADEASEWMEDNSNTAKTPQVKSQLENLRDSLDKLVYRKVEKENRPHLIKSLEDVITKSRETINNYSEKYTEEELEPVKDSLEKLEVLIEDVSLWLETKLAAQNKLKDTENPVLTIESIVEKSQSIQDAFTKLAAKKIKKKSTPSTEAEKPTDDATADDDENQEQDDTNEKAETTAEQDDPDAKENYQHDEL
ncbi:lumenal Hsp70 protein [Mycoemilia scoparia]|uniref:Lumenal Hsp70 protein n=1 Tax=Mycoemilia scoparia TaxID=417184 RepID=A0A9W8DSW7_9FUNG|nr:lumenal Hsp70 protein [Mycoemilia scoparia]